jgi:hypothetical protein
MTKDELEQIQSICRQWMSEPTTHRESRLTIPSGVVLPRTMLIEIKGLLTFDNVRILSAIDVDSGVCYTKLIGNLLEVGTFIDAPFEMIEAGANETSASDATAAANSVAVPCVQPTITQPRIPASDMLAAEADSDSGPPRFLLYSNQTLLGYSLLEKTRSAQQKSGRFYPSDDYFDYSQLFEAFPQAENDWMEVSAREAYGLTADNAGEYRKRFAELSEGIEALRLYLADAEGRAIETAEVGVEDLSRHYDDQSERWLHVEFSK